MFLFQSDCYVLMLLLQDIAKLLKSSEYQTSSYEIKRHTFNFIVSICDFATENTQISSYLAHLVCLNKVLPLLVGVAIYDKFYSSFAFTIISASCNTYSNRELYLHICPSYSSGE